MARGNATKLLEATEEAFRQISVFIQMSTIGSLFGAVAARRDHRLSARGIDARHQCLCIVSLVANDRAGAQALDQCAGLRDIGHLAARQPPAQRVAQRIYCSVNLGA